MHNLKKYFGILDYALRVFSKCFPLYEIPLNISTLFRPVHCVSFYKIAFKRSSLYEAHTELIKAKIQLKIKETAHHFSKTSCDLSPLSASPSLQSMWNY